MISVNNDGPQITRHIMYVQTVLLARSLFYATRQVCTCVFTKIESDADRQQLQDDLNKLTEWSEKWQMLFNYGKCKRLHTAHGNEVAQYTMSDTVLNTTVKEKELGLTISADMKVSEQCAIAAAKGNHIFGLIRRNIVYKKRTNNTAV